MILFNVDLKYMLYKYTVYTVFVFTKIANRYDRRVKIVPKR